MKREFLKNLGLEDDKVESIMAEHGKTVTALNTKVTDLTSQVTDVNDQLKQRDKDIKDLKKNAGDNEELQTQLSDLQTKYDDAAKEYKSNLKATQTASAIKLALHDKTHDVDLVTGLIDTKKLVVGDDGNITAGLDEQLKELQESKSFLFVQAQEPSKPTLNIPPSGSVNSAGITKESFDKMNYQDRLNLYNTDKATYDSLINE